MSIKHLCERQMIKDRKIPKSAVKFMMVRRTWASTEQASKEPVPRTDPWHSRHDPLHEAVVVL
jgi:hypothetical protein